MVTVLTVASDILDSTEPALALSTSTDSSGAASSGLSGVESSCLCSMPGVFGYGADMSKLVVPISKPDGLTNFPNPVGICITDCGSLSASESFCSRAGPISTYQY